MYNIPGEVDHCLSNLHLTLRSCKRAFASSKSAAARAGAVPFMALTFAAMSSSSPDRASPLMGSL